MNLPPDFRELLEEFARERVEHVVIGGYAYAFHAEPRATKDLDLLLDPSAENLARAARALATYGAPSNVVEAVRNMSATDVVYLGRPPLRIDLLCAVDGVDTKTILGNAVDGSWDGLPVQFVGLDDLIANKRASGRPQDLADAEKLEQVKSRGRSR